METTPTETLSGPASNRLAQILEEQRFVQNAKGLLVRLPPERREEDAAALALDQRPAE